MAAFSLFQSLSRRTSEITKIPEGVRPGTPLPRVSEGVQAQLGQDGAPVVVCQPLPGAAHTGHALVDSTGFLRHPQNLPPGYR